MLMLIVFLSCNESKTVRLLSEEQAYYPLKIGQYRIYEVEEITYQVVGFDTATYHLRETIADSIVSRDQVKYLIRREKRDITALNWTKDSVWTVVMDDRSLQIEENGTIYVKLAFPVSIGDTWDGNAFNSQATQNYAYDEITVTVIDSISLDKQIRVVIEDIEENITGVDVRSEVYVQGIGLVEKDYLTQVICTSSSCGADLGNVVAGRSLKQTLIEVGHE